MTDIVQGAHFRTVDAGPAPHGLLATLDAVAAREGVRRLKQRGLDLLAVAAGQRLLDVGSVGRATTSAPWPPWSARAG